MKVLWKKMDEDLKIRIKLFLVMSIGFPLTVYIVMKCFFWLMDNYEKIPTYAGPFVLVFFWFFFWGIVIFKRG